MLYLTCIIISPKFQIQVLLNVNLMDNFISLCKLYKLANLIHYLITLQEEHSLWLVLKLFQNGGQRTF